MSQISRRAFVLGSITLIVGSGWATRAGLEPADAPYTYTVIAQGQPTNIWEPSINNNGQVAFLGTALFRGDGSGPATALPSAVGGGPVGGETPINVHGVVAFAYFIPVGSGSSGIATTDGISGVQRIAQDNASWNLVRNPDINDAGDVVFGARSVATGTMHILKGTGLESVVSTGDLVPGGTLINAHFPDINNNGDIAFVANISGGPTSLLRKRGSEYALIYPDLMLFGMNDAGAVAHYRAFPNNDIVAADGTTTTVVAGQSAGFFPQPHRTSINNQGLVAFLVGDGTGLPSGYRVFVGDGTVTRPVLRAGDIVSGLGTIVDVSIGNHAINDAGQVAIKVNYTDVTGIVRGAIVRADPPDTDADDDGVPDDEDAFPNDPNESRDTDGDGVGDNADADDDGDGQTDSDEAACGSDPRNAGSRSPDADGDGRPDCVDLNAPPVITTPGTLVVEATFSAGAVVNYVVSVADPDDPGLVASCVPPSGSVFPVGTTTVSCTATDTNGSTASASFAVTVRDTTLPGVFIASPRYFDLIVDGPLNIQVLATDAIGVTSVSARADVSCTADFSNCSITTPSVDLQLGSGVPQSGTWTGQLTSQYLLRTVPYILRVTVTDAAGNARTISQFVDNDGLGPQIDRARADFNIDQSSIASREFNTGTTAGTINHATGLLSVDGVLNGGVRITAEIVTPFLTSPPHGGMCTGRDKQFFLDVTGEVLDLECTGDTVRARAVVALPEIVVRKLLPGERCEFVLGFPFCEGRLYWIYAPLQTGYSLRTGSPFEADPANPGPITLEIRRLEADGSEATIGTVVLDPGEKADIEFIAGPEFGTELAVVTALAGDIEVTIGGATSTVQEGQTSNVPLEKLTQTISFPALPNLDYGHAAIELDATASSGLPVAYTATGPSCSVSGSTLALIGVGPCTVTASQPGDAYYFAATSVSHTFHVFHTWSGVLQPLASSGVTVKLGSTVPVKFRLTGASASITTLAARIYATKLSDATGPGDEIQLSTNAGDTGNTFRYDPAAGQYIFNWSTKGLTEGTWLVRIDLLDGNATRTVEVVLKK